MLVQLLVKGVLLGLGAAVPIGPVNVEIARRTLRSGFRAGFALGCDAVTVDITYAAMTSLSLYSLVARPVVQMVLGVGGAILLLYLAGLCFASAARSLRAPAAALEAPATAGSLRGGYVTGLLMTLLNPLTLAFWFLVVPAIAGQVEVGGGHRAGLLIVCAGVFLGTISWVICFAGLLNWAGQFRRSWWIVAADAIGGAILLGFAATAAWGLVLRSR